MMTSPIPLPPFALHYPVGEGGTATVWRGTHAALGQPVAIKVMASRYGGARGGLFAREVRAVARLDHPGIIRVHDHGRLDPAVAEAVGRAPGTPYLVMAWCGDGTLSTRRGRLPWAEVRRVLLAILDALGRAHAVGVVHRDLKPSNILLDGARPVIADFGLGFDSDAVDGGLRVTSGTPGYMAPEQIDGRWRHFGPQTDLYALGCTAWALVAGRSPFAAGDAEATRRRHRLHAPAPFAPRVAVPPAFEGWLRGLIAADPGARPRFAAHAAAALRAMPAALADEPRPGPHPPRGEPTPTATPSATPTGTPSATPTDGPISITPTPVFEPRAAVAVGVAVDGERRPGAIRLPDCGRSLAELREPHLRGRNAERRRLWQALCAVCTAGRPAAVVIEGSAGIGKTRLTEWLTRRAHQEGRAEAMRATHQPDPGAASGVGAMLSRRLRLGGLDGPARAARLAELGYEGEAAAALLAALDPAGVAAVEGHRVRLTRPDARAAVLVRAIERLAAACPCIFVIDDAHWGPDAVEIAARLLTRGAAPVLMVLTRRRHRAPALDGLAARPDVQRIDLAPLSTDAIGAIAEDRVSLDPRVRQRLAAHVGGNPSFASEMVRHWIDSDLLVPGPTGHGLRSDAALIVEPTALWWARLRRAVAEPRVLPFQIAAALGLEVDEGEWRAVCRRAGVAVADGDVEALFDASLARPSADGQWAFVHAGLRRALIERAVDPQALHRHCAAVLAERAGVDIRRVATHHEAAGDLEAAYADWMRAWHVTRRRSTAAEGRRCLISAARICRRLGAAADGPRFTAVRVWWSLLASNTGARDSARRHADRALRDARRRADAAQITLALMMAGLSRANVDSAGSVALLREANARSACLAVEEASTCARWLCDQLLFTGDRHGARRALDEATPRARAAGHDEALAYLALRRAELCAVDGEPVAAERSAVEARAAFAASGDRFGLAHVGMVRGLIARDEARWTDAIAAFEAARRTFRQMGHQNLAVAECNLSQVLLCAGRFAAARAAAERGRAAAIEMRNDVYRVMAEMTLLPTVAQAADRDAWDRCWQTLTEVQPRVGLTLVDGGEALADAAARAAAAGWPTRAARARAMAIAQFEGAGCPERAAALRALDAISTR